MVELLGGEGLRLALPESFGFRGVETARGLHQRIKTAPSCPWAFVAIGAERNVKDPGPQPRNILRAKAMPGDRAWPIALHENVGVPHQRRQRLARVGLAQIKRGR